MREAASAGHFRELESLLEREESLKKLRKVSSIPLILGGDDFLKVHSLNMRAYVLDFDKAYEPMLIEGQSLLPSPVLTPTKEVDHVLDAETFTFMEIPESSAFIL